MSVENGSRFISLPNFHVFSLIVDFFEQQFLYIFDLKSIVYSSNVLSQYII